MKWIPSKDSSLDTFHQKEIVPDPVTVVSIHVL